MSSEALELAEPVTEPTILKTLPTNDESGSVVSPDARDPSAWLTAGTESATWKPPDRAEWLVRTESVEPVDPDDPKPPNR